MFSRSQSRAPAEYTRLPLAAFGILGLGLTPLLLPQQPKERGRRDNRDQLSIATKSLYLWQHRTGYVSDVARNGQLSCMLIDTEKEHGDPPVRKSESDSLHDRARF
ncbi:MAG TPA: hypothetical protein DD473_00735, partial [Planctomycetaceae bacterium]|nr:hypothetical protein [Planctomycetaceae bacterium]